MLQIYWREKRPAQAIGQPVHVNRRLLACSLRAAIILDRRNVDLMLGTDRYRPRTGSPVGLTMQGRGTCVSALRRE
jgi:hypothetical protein